MPIEPDDKNWTWVLNERCPECGYDASAVDVTAMAELVRANVAEWPAAMGRADAGVRPTDAQWSALEYGCHVRDVFRLFDERLRLMLEEDQPQFADWNQDDAAVEGNYRAQDPTVVIDELVAAGEASARRWASVGHDDWQRGGDRSDGSSFTVESFARYFLHDPVHHLVDVGRGNAALSS